MAGKVSKMRFSRVRARLLGLVLLAQLLNAHLTITWVRVKFWQLKLCISKQGKKVEVNKKRKSPKATKIS